MRFTITSSIFLETNFKSDFSTFPLYFFRDFAFSVRLLRCLLKQGADFFHECVVIFFFVRERAVYTRFSAFFRVVEVAAAFLAGEIKRTETEKAVEIFWIVCFVAREHLARAVLKKLVVFSSAF